MVDSLKKTDEPSDQKKSLRKDLRKYLTEYGSLMNKKEYEEIISLLYNTDENITSVLLEAYEDVKENMDEQKWKVLREVFQSLKKKTWNDGIYSWKYKI